MFRKRLLRFYAILLALTICVSVLGGVSVVNRISKFETKKENSEAMQAPISNEVNNLAQSQAENLKFKISELWRLSLNSDLDAEIKNAVQIINQNYDSGKLVDAVKKTAEGFDVVADEYLASLQMGTNFDMYVSDSENYEREKDDINYREELLTVEKIDEYLNELNAKKAEDIVNRTNNEQVNLPIIESPNVQPEVPNAESVLPKNPADEIRKEIDSITNR